MEYQKISNLLDDASSKISKFRTKNWVEINDESKGTYNAIMLKFSLCDYSDAYIHVKGTVLLIILLLQMLMQIILIKR